MEYTHKVLNEVYYWMLSKQKTIEVRPLSEKEKKIAVGDFITFYNKDFEEKFVKVKVVEKKYFTCVEDILKTYDINLIMPGHKHDDIKQTLEEIYGEKYNKKELVAFKIEYISSDKTE